LNKNDYILYWSKNIKKILSSGLYLLEIIGHNNWALTKEQTLKAICEFEKQNIAILGGEVFKIIDGEPEFIDPGWVCNRDKNESFKDFSKQTIFEARKYIKNITFDNSSNIRYVLVPSEEHEEI